MEYRVELPWLAGVCSRMLLGFFFCWRTVSLEDTTSLEDAVSCTSVCKYDGVVRVCVV